MSIARYTRAMIQSGAFGDFGHAENGNVPNAEGPSVPFLEGALGSIACAENKPWYRQVR